MTPDSSSMDSLSTAKNWPIVWLWGKRLLMFQHELDPHSHHINAPRATVYRALLDARAIARWVVPSGVTLVANEQVVKVLEFGR